VNASARKLFPGGSTRNEYGYSYGRELLAVGDGAVRF
jgi:hypothetical protein